jgi:hypothetical protein
MAALGVGLVFIGVFLHITAQVFEDFRVEDGGTDLVDAHGPFAKINLAAAIAAKGKVLVGEANEHAAGGAAEEFDGFFTSSH